MAKTISVNMRCTKSKRDFKTYFEENSAGEWYGVRTETTSNGLIGELSRAFSLFSSKKKNEENDHDGSTVNGAFYTGEYKCPYCSNSSFAECGSCGKWNCLAESAENFICAFCNTHCNITGSISSATGDVSGASNSLSGSNSDKFRLG